MNAWKRAGLGRVTKSRPLRVAQRGTGPETVSRTGQPRALAAAMSGSYLLQS